MQKITDTNFKMREKKRWYIITSLSLFFLCVLLVVFFPENTKIQKQTMTIIVSIDDNNEQFVAHISSEKGKKYTKKLLAINRNNVYDLTNIILLVKEYESNGWKTINSNMEIPTLKEKNKLYFYFFMQK